MADPASGLDVDVDVDLVPSDCIDLALSHLAGPDPPHVVVYFAHRAARGCDGADRQVDLTAALRTHLEAGGGVVLFHHWIYEAPGKEAVLQLLGGVASSIEWNTEQGQRVIATNPGHFEWATIRRSRSCPTSGTHGWTSWPRTVSAEPSSSPATTPAAVRNAACSAMRCSVPGGWAPYGAGTGDGTGSSDSSGGPDGGESQTGPGQDGPDASGCACAGTIEGSHPTGWGWIPVVLVGRVRRQIPRSALLG